VSPLIRFVPEGHQYWSDGRRVPSATTLAKKFQDSWLLDKYAKRQVAVGLAARPDLVRLVIARGGDDTQAARNAIDAVCEQAYEAAKATAKANEGTARHLVLERVDRGEKFVPADAGMRNLIEGYRAELSRSGLSPRPDLVERIVFFPKEWLIGTFDRGYHWCGHTLLGDLKSGANAVRYPHSTVAQMGLYLLAPTMYDAERDELVDPPRWGEQVIVVHIPMEGMVELWTIPADTCREVGEQALWMKQWLARGADSLVARFPLDAPPRPEPPPFDAPPAPTAPATEVERTEDGDTGAAPTVSRGEALARLSSQPDEGPPADPAKVERLRENYFTLDRAATAWIGELMHDSQMAGVSFHLKNNLTARRVAIVEGLVELALHQLDNDEIVRAVAETVLGDVAQFPSVPAGHVLGSMDAEQALAFLEACRRAIAPDAFTVDEAGVMRLGVNA
jgi:hypothetical protein